MMQEFVQQVKETISESLDGVHTCIPGEIVSFDAGNCTAVVKPIGKSSVQTGRRLITHKSQRFQYTSSKAARRKAASVSR